MENCSNCKVNVIDREIKTCKNCGAIFCSNCFTKTKDICPYCYSNLEY